MAYSMAAFPAVSPPPFATKYGGLPPSGEDFIAAYYDGPLPWEEDSTATNNGGLPPSGEDLIAAYFDGPVPWEGDCMLNIPLGSPSIAAVCGGPTPSQEDFTAANPPPSEEDWKLSIPPGVKFRPTDEELILNYLQVEYLHGYVQRGIISYADVYEYQPHQLQAFAADHGDGKLYFFTKIKKIGRSKTDRGVKSKNGYWKATQAPKSIKGESGSTIGFRICLTYFENRIKTPWLMNEYRLDLSHDSQHSSEELVLVVVYHPKRRNDND